MTVLRGSAKLTDCGARVLRAAILSISIPIGAIGLRGQDEPPRISAALVARAEAGDPAAEARLGYAYENTAGYVDRSRAAYWYRKSAEAGNPDGEEGWAVICQYDLDGSYHDAKAADWFRKSAQQGNVSAEKDLGAAYEDGNGVPQDYELAARWYKKAANQGDGFAQFRLGELYARGAGVPQSIGQAVTWLSLAARQDEPGASEALKSAEASEASDPHSFAHLQAFLSGLHETELQRQQRLKRLIDEWTFAAIVAAWCVAALYLALHRIHKRRIIAPRTRTPPRVQPPPADTYASPQDTPRARPRARLPRTLRARQLAIILPAAIWCSGCCICEALDPTSMRHPVNAAVTVALYSAPAVILGAVGLWWLASDRKPQ